MNNTSDCPNASDNLLALFGGDWTKFHSQFFPERALYNMLLIWFALGIPGSLLSLIIWTRKRMRLSSSVYLSALALTDLSVLILAIIFYLHQAWDLHVLDFPVWCELFPTAYMWAQYSCPLLTLAFTVERYISVCHPFQHEHYCTVSRAVKVTSSILCGCLATALVQLAVHQYKFDKQLCDAHAWLESASGERLYTIWSWLTEIAMFGVVPASILVFNIKVIAEMRRMKRREHAIGAAAINSKATTITLLCVSFCLILGTLPATIVFALTKYMSEGNYCLRLAEVARDPTWTAYLRFNLVKTVIYNVCSGHYAINFYIYILTGKAFRKEFLRLAGVCFRRLHCCRDRRSDRRCYSTIVSTKRSVKEHNGAVDTTFV